MSHLSQIKTQIDDTKILQKTLVNLGFKYTMKQNNKYDMSVITTDSESFELLWNGREYYLVADFQLWKKTPPAGLLVDKITQQYSYNSIIEESVRYGFTNFSREFMKDGSIKLVVQRWI